MPKQRHNASGGGQNLGRVGAVGVLAAGALCAAVLSVASRVPPTPIDTERIPSVEIGSATEGGVRSTVRKDRRSGSLRRDGKRTNSTDRARHRGRRAAGGGRRGAARARGSALPVAYTGSGGGAGQNAVGGPQSGDGSDRPVSGTGPGGGSGGDGPGARGNGGGGRQPAPSGGGGGDGAQPRNVAAPAPAAPTPAPAPAAAQPASVVEPVDDEASAPTETAASEDESESEPETEPAAAIRAPTLASAHDSDDE
jgi:hypothetical protein